MLPLNRTAIVVAIISIFAEPTMADTSGPKYVLSTLTGDLVKNSDSALSIAKILVSANYGDEVLQEQAPLSVADEGTHWMIEGSLNKNRDNEGPGRILIKIRKSDSKVEYLKFDYVLKNK